MTKISRWPRLVFLLCLISLSSQTHALEILHFIEGGEHAAVFADATGLKITDAGVVYVTSEKKGTILKIVDGNIEAISLTPSVFKDSDLGGVDVLTNGNLVVVNEGSGQVGIIDPDFKVINLFSQSGGSPGELDDPRPVAVSVNKNIYVGNVDRKQISVFNQQGLFLYSFGKQSSDGKDLLKPTHVSIDAEENVYVLEGRDRLSIFDYLGNLLARITSSELKEIFGDKPELTAMTTDLNGTLYLGDFETSRVFIYDWRKAEVIGKFGALGQSRAQYRDINYLSVNAKGQIAVLDKKNKKVEVFQLDQTSFAQPVSRDLLELGTSTDLSCAVTQAFVDGRMLCIKSDSPEIVMLAADGSEQGRFAEEAKRPSSIYIGDETVAVLDKNTLHAYSHDGKHLFSIGRYGISAGGFKDPSDVFIQNGLYYVADKGNNRVQVFAADGQFLEQIKPTQDGEKLFIEVGPLAVDSEENLYIADGSALGLIHVINKDRKKIATIGIEQDSIYKVTKFHGLDIDKQNRLYVLASSDYNDYSISIYKEFKLYRAFGAEGKNGTQVYFEEASSISVASGAGNSVYINDPDLKKTFRFDILEYPDAAFGLNIAANRETIELQWSSSQSPLIAKYEIQAATTAEGPFTAVSSSSVLKQTLSVDDGGKYSWFRIVSVSGHGLRASPSTARENIFQRINSLYLSGEFDETIKLADRLLKIAPDNADTRDILGMSLYQQQDYTRAIAEFKQLEAVKRFHNKAIRYQVQAYFDLEQFLDARALIDEVLEKSPAEIEPYMICTRLSLKLADEIGAVTCAEDGLQLHPGNVELRYLLGRAYIEAGIVEEGLLAYQTIVDTAPDNYELRVKIAADLYDLGSYEESLTHFEAVNIAMPESGAAAVGKARALLALERDDEAKAIAVKLSGKKETKGDGYYLLGKIATKQGKHKEAVLRMTRASKDIPERVDAWVSLAQSYIEINRLPKAVKALAQGIKYNPEAFELYQLAGKIELDREKYPDANTYLGKAVLLEPQSMSARKLYARGLFATRNYRSAAIHAEAAAGIAPDDIDVLVLQADIANQRGKTGSAIEFLKTAINLDTASAELQYRIGRVYQDANLFDASRDHLEKAAGIRPAWGDPHVALGNLYGKRRLFDDAISSFEKAVELDPSESNRAMLNVAFAERTKSLEFSNNTPQLLLSDLNLKRVFSAAYKKYQDQAIGSVKLQNVSATDYGNLKLSFQIKEYMDFPSSIDISVIKGGEIQEFPIKATFNNKILEVDEDTGVQVEVKLTYLRDGQKDDISLTQPMTIYGKNAIVWGEPKMIGSFVTPKDDTLRDYVRQVINAYRPDPGPLNDRMVSAMAYFASLTASGANYIIDPNTPFTELTDDQIDYVQFPRETLRLKSGDCDDLSVLISAGLENLGIGTAMVETPGHLFMMFDTGIPEQDAGLISQDRSLLVFKDGNVWIPLEATMINTTFTEAWAEAANKYQIAMAANNLGIIDMSQAWQEYKPVTLRKANYSIEIPEKKRTESLIKQSHTQLLVRSIDRLVLPYLAMVANNPQNITARLQVAILYARFGLYEDAEIAFEALDELAPDNSSVKTNQGNLYFLQHDYTRAIENYTRASELDSEDGGIWINLSMAQFKAGDSRQAESSFQHAVQLDSQLQKDYEAYSKLLSQ